MSPFALYTIGTSDIVNTDKDIYSCWVPISKAGH